VERRAAAGPDDRGDQPGRIRALLRRRCLDGGVIWQAPLATPPDQVLWSSPLVCNGSIYEGAASSLDCPLVRGEVVQLDAATGAVHNTLYPVPGGCLGAGVRGSPTVDPAAGGIYFAAGNAAPGGSPEPLAIALIETGSPLNVRSSWPVPSSQQPSTGSDFGSTPTLSTATINGVARQMIGLQNKNGIYYAFNRSAISAGPRWQRRMSGGGVCPECVNGHGADMSPSAHNGQHLFVGGEKTTINATTRAGSVRQLRPSTGAVVWSARLHSGPVIGAVTAVPGAAFAGAGNTAYALNTSTGAVLRKYQDSSSGSDFWGAPAISNGHAYSGNQDGTLYAFGT